MTQPLAFHKYSLYGNHFVLVDEIEHSSVLERQRSPLARRAADAHAGIGADSVVFLQPFTPTSVEAIQAERRYWKSSDISGAAAPCFIARFFEPNGDEFHACADALLCIAQHLFFERAIDTSSVLIEVPSRRPRLCRLTYSPKSGMSSVELEPDMSRIADFVDMAFGAHAEDGCMFFGARDLGLATRLSGLLLHTGEPHMVLFQSHQASPPAGWPPSVPWQMSCTDLFGRDTSPSERSALWTIGHHVNRALRRHFPQGLSVNFARAHTEPSTFEYRCFERGLERETLACGTGALAVSIAARRLGLVRGNELRMLPDLARRHERFAHAALSVVRSSPATYVLSASAEQIFRGCLLEQP